MRTLSHLHLHHFAPHLAMGLALLLAPGCDEETTDVPDPLPEQPQIQSSVAFVTFNVVPAGGSQEKDVVFLNGGQNDLVIDSIDIANNPGVFDILRVEPADMVAASRGAVTITLIFEPNARGVSSSQLVVTSNAENNPELELQIVGPAQAQLFPGDRPDLLLFEDTVTVIEDTVVVVDDNDTPDDESDDETTYLDAAFVRFINLGDESAAIAGYDIDPEGGRFRFALGVPDPTIDEPIPLAPGNFTVLTIIYDDRVAGDTTATFTLTHYDYVEDEEKVCLADPPGSDNCLRCSPQSPNPENCIEDPAGDYMYVLPPISPIQAPVTLIAE